MVTSFYEDCLTEQQKCIGNVEEQSKLDGYNLSELSNPIKSSNYDSQHLDKGILGEMQRIIIN